MLAWAAEWYFREETLEAANATIVDYHHRLPMAQAFGTGTLSSSDGQRFPVKGKSLTARHLSRYFARGQGISAYTHVSDQHSTFDTKVIAATAPESHYVLDGILGNQADLPVAEHATDTHGATLANFALFDLLGLQLSPRIRDLGKITLYRPGPKAGFTTRVPVRRAPAHPPPQRGPDHGDVGRPAAGGRLSQGRACHGRAGGRETVLVETAAERAGLRD